MELTLADLRHRAADCRADPLRENATQAVFGEGPPSANIVLVGEQPGDREDLAGRPFVGPVGEILDQALVEAGFDRRNLYVTNVVKHFKWEPRGKRRSHKTPAQREIEACRQWFDRELNLLSLALIVCLGAAATRALVGPTATVTAIRGQILRH